MKSEAEVTKYIEDFPSPAEIKLKLEANNRERKLLNQMLKISEQRGEGPPVHSPMMLDGGQHDG